MMRSMFAAISGLRNHQTFMDVVGNNIANVNTTGFKASRVTFQDILSQTIRGASGPTETLGGINPIQVGLGMLLAGIDTIQTQGNLQSTGKVTDLAIQGNGFFVLNDGFRDFYTRDGAFDIALDGSLVNPANGMKVQGWQADANGKIDTAQPMGAITIPLGQGMIGQASSKLKLLGNLDLTAGRVGAISQSDASSGTATISGTYSGSADLNYVVRIAAVDAAGAVTQVQVSTDGGTTFGAAVNVVGGVADVGNGLTMAIATNPNNTAGDTYSFTTSAAKFSTSAGVYDSLGVLHNIRLDFQRAAANNTWTWTATPEPGVTLATSTGTVTFLADGRYDTTQPEINLVLGLPNGAASPQTVALDMTSLSQLAGNGELNTQTDGAAAGSLVTFTVGQSGEVTGIYSNGLNRTLGQIALATFGNPGGLTHAGGNLLEVSANSGDPQVGVPGAGGRGTVSPGFLEMSNVDLAQQFTNMIMAERGFQSNSRVITTSDEMLQDLVNLKR